MDQSLASWLGGRRGHFGLESGHHGDLWLELETLCLKPAAIRSLAGQLTAKLSRYEVDVICGPLVDGAFVALMVALELGCDFTYTERFQNPEREGLFPVEYRLPRGLRNAVRGKRVAIVNDVINAGSAVRGTFADLQALGAHAIALGALVALGDTIAKFAHENGVPLELLESIPSNLWTPADCPLCAKGVALEIVATA
jgi:orotate phosphoribosyltransferase